MAGWDRAACCCGQRGGVCVMTLTVASDHHSASPAAAVFGAIFTPVDNSVSVKTDRPATPDGAAGRGCAALWTSARGPVGQGVFAISETTKHGGFPGGSSPAGAGYDAASDIEAQLARPGSVMSTDVLFPSQPAPVVRSHVHELRLRHVCHGGLLCWSRGKARGLRRADTRRRPYEPGRIARSKGRPVRALRDNARGRCGAQG